MKTGLFFGSFDPIHNGHLIKAVEALEKNLVDRVVFVPAKQNPWKSEPMFDYKKRMLLPISFVSQWSARMMERFLSLISRDR